MFNSNKAVSDFPERMAKTLVGKNLKSLADLLGVSYDNFELEMPFVIEGILMKTGDLVSFEKSEQPKSKAPEMTADELADLEDEFEASSAKASDGESDVDPEEKKKLAEIIASYRSGNLTGRKLVQRLGPFVRRYNLKSIQTVEGRIEALEDIYGLSDDDNTNIEEVLNITEDQLRRLLA